MCGIVGIWGPQEAAKECYQALLVLQHRGQDAAGILSFDQDHRRFYLHKGIGLTDQVFDSQSLEKLTGNTAVGHVRYTTVGDVDNRDVQPLTLNYPFGMGLCHNGNLVNFFELVDFLRDHKSRHIFTKNDAEVLINLLSDYLAHAQKKLPHTNESESTGHDFNFELLCKAVEYLFQYAKGAFSVVGPLAERGLFGFRDPHGIRPLVLGTKQAANGKTHYCLASESVALSFLGYEFTRDIEPGEVVWIDQNGQLHSKVLAKKTPAHCMFEWIYFANPESFLEKNNVYSSRLRLGKLLGDKVRKVIAAGTIDPDIVVPIPDTSRVAAVSLSETLKLPYRELLNKNRYVQRSFILSGQEKREKAVKLKLTPIKSEVKGKKILLVDDSIVRGTTSKRLISMLQEAGAEEIAIASTCPPIKFPCVYGIDFPSSEELLAYRKAESDIAKFLNCQAAIYLETDDLEKCIPNSPLCKACLNGKYPVGEEYLTSFREKRHDN